MPVTLVPVDLKISFQALEISLKIFSGLVVVEVEEAGFVEGLILDTI